MFPNVTYDRTGKMYGVVDKITLGDEGKRGGRSEDEDC